MCGYDAHFALVDKPLPGPEVGQKKIRRLDRYRAVEQGHCFDTSIFHVLDCQLEHIGNQDAKQSLIKHNPCPAGNWRPVGCDVADHVGWYNDGIFSQPD